MKKKKNKKNLKFKLLMFTFTLLIVTVFFIAGVMKSINTVPKILEKTISDDSYVIELDNTSETEYNINIVGENTLKDIKDIITSLPAAKRQEKYNIYFSLKPYKKNDLFNDENLLASAYISNNKLIEYISEIYIEPSLEIRNTFEVTEIMEDTSGILNIKIKINGDTPNNIIANTKKIVAAIVDTNNMEESTNVITYIDTEASDYILSFNEDNLVKIIEEVKEY